MYFPFFQREHKVHHHILSAGLFALLFIHAYLGIDALLAGPTVMQKTGKITALERQTMSYKELAREARKLIISARKKGKTLKLVEAMHIVKNGVYNGSGVTTARMKSTASGQTVKNEDSLSFSSAPTEEISANEIFGARVTSKKKKTTTSTLGSTGGSTSITPPTSGGSSGGSTSTSTTTSGGSSGGSTSTSTTPSGGSTGGSSSASTTTPTTTTPSSSGTTSSSGSTSTGTTAASGTTSTSTSTGSTTTSTGAVASTGTTAPSSTGSATTGSTSTSSTSTSSTTTTSSSSTMISIGSTENPQIKKLSDYQKVVGGFVSNQLMVFLNMPESAANIEGASYYMANTANEFAKYGITPIFIIEPYGDNGQLDLGKIKNGDYIAKLDSLFALLKGARGLTEDKLGILVPYPEINTPAFDRTNFVPSDLPILVNQYFDVVRKYYPNARGGLLLDGKSYDINKTWGQGEYKSYSPYISGIKSGYISYFGIQGFPWVSNDGADIFYNPSVFLPISLGVEAANMLSTKNIWFNTGTMRKSYKTNTVYTTPEERQAMMNGIINQGKNLIDQGYSVMINIFAENKFQMGEGIDWSYIDSASDGVLSADESVFSTFISGAKNAGITVALFDM